MNRTIDNILARRSVCSYQKKPVPREKFYKIVECVFAASVMGKQSWHFTAVTNRALLDEISQINHRILRAAGNLIA